MNKYDELRQIYLNWLLTPPGEREPATKTDFAEQYDMNRSTLYDWENSDEFQTKMKAALGKWGVRQYGEVLNRLMDIVENGPPAPAVSAAKVLLSHIARIETQGSDKDLTPDEFASLKDALKERGFAVIEDE